MISNSFPVVWRHIFEFRFWPLLFSISHWSQDLCVWKEFRSEEKLVKNCKYKVSLNISLDPYYYNYYVIPLFWFNSISNSPKKQTKKCWILVVCLVCCKIVHFICVIGIVQILQYIKYRNTMMNNKVIALFIVMLDVHFTNSY